MTVDWLVAADDRTGALEVAAEIASVTGGSVPVVVHPSMRAGAVVDLGSRRCTRDDAAARATSVEDVQVVWTAHKIDSTLRGNWVDELRARQSVSGRRVLLIAAWPAMGRTCVDGVVHVHGERHGDLRDHVAGVGVLRSDDEVRRWLDEPVDHGWAACDVIDSDQMRRLASLVAQHDDVMPAAPAGPIGAVFAARLGLVSRQRGCALQQPALVVCGSATEVAAAQVAELRRLRPDIPVIAATRAGGGELDPMIAEEIAAEGRRRAAATGCRTVVVVGGDTAAAFLGSDERRVGGTVLPGLPWSTGTDDHVVVVTKAGAFGSADTLVRLFEEEDAG